VIWSDEKKFNLDRPDGVRYYWRDLRRDPRIFSTRNFGGGSLMIWAGFSGFGKLDLEVVSTKMKSEDYQKVLDNNLKLYLRKFQAANLTFMLDNASIHASRSTKEYLQRSQIQVLEWPAISPDLNPIENMWGIIVRDVYGNGRQFLTIKEL